MPYLSTRDRRQPPERIPFDAVLRDGLAHDGGLYLPAAWPMLSAADLTALRGKSYAEIALRVTTPFLDGIVAPPQWEKMIEAAYADFDDPDIAPLKQLGDGFWLEELFHGPTLAFKDYALQLVGPLFDHVLDAARRARHHHRRHLGRYRLGGDRGVPRRASSSTSSSSIRKGRISEVQRRQMTTVTSPNVHAIAVEGTFDDCQDLVKAMFADAPFRARSEPFGRQLDQLGARSWPRSSITSPPRVALGAPERAVAFAVPTGNFGNVYAAMWRARMGAADRASSSSAPTATTS